MDACARSPRGNEGDIVGHGQGDSQLCGEVSKVVPRCGGVCMAGEYEILSHRSECSVIIFFSCKVTNMNRK